MFETMYSKDAALLMLKVRNLLQEETGIRIPLSEEGAVSRFLELADQSKRPEIRRAAHKLRALVGSTEPDADAASPTATAGKRLYRGSPIADKVRQPRPPEAEEPPKPRGKVITYRGQKIVV